MLQVFGLSPRKMYFITRFSLIKMYLRDKHGNIDTLKQHLIEGNPIIVFIRIPKDTHYAVVVGYDEQCIYLVDSLEENANAQDTRYNRVLTKEAFEDVWKTRTLLPKNIYIVVRTTSK